ncbi:MAG: type phosphodiesterase/nucleotide pyrophosphatase [Bacteroidota bacterium]|nr:type phosphodiesterase/nucleotide pyrophosphatase [Bacteroidota bacterium]
MKKFIFILTIIYILTGCNKKACKNVIGPPSGNSLKVLLIGIDGCRTDAFRAANTPHFDSLAASGIRCWYVDRGPYTVSVPGWSTILHGVFPAKHGLIKNSFEGNHYAQYPDVFTIAKKVHPDWQLFSLTNWDGFMKVTSNDTYCESFSNDAAVAAKAVEVLNKDNPDILLLHFDETDAAGHSSGFSPTNREYIKTIENIDEYAGSIFTAIQHREQVAAEKWLIIVCTDHGGEGTSHGDQDDIPQTRFVFFIVNGPGIPAFDKTSAANTDLLPTMLKYLNISVDSSAGLDGVALY